MHAYRRNMDRYRRLLRTRLTEPEREYIERRLFEEQSALETLRKSAENIVSPIHGAARD